MIALLLSLMVVASAAAADAEVDPGRSSRILFGVDPNHLSCDPFGLMYLLLPHHTDCNKFYKCVHGREMEFTCPFPLLFDFVSQVCNWEFLAVCTLRDIEVEGSGDYDEGTIEFAGHPGADEQFETPLKVVEDFKAPLICKDATYSNIRVAHKDDCRRYWRCADSEVSSVSCAEGLYFNGKTQQCDYEANVVCYMK